MGSQQSGEVFHDATEPFVGVPDVKEFICVNRPEGLPTEGLYHDAELYVPGYVEQVKEHIQGKVQGGVNAFKDQANEQVIVFKEQVNEQVHGVKEHVNEQVNGVKDGLKDVATVTGGVILFSVAAGRLHQAVKDLKYGPEMWQQTDGLVRKVDAMLLVRDQLPEEVVALLARIYDEATQLRDKIAKHCKRTNGGRVIGALAGATGGACLAVSPFVKSEALASGLQKGALGLGLGFAGVEIIAGVADWFTDHHSRLMELSNDFEGAQAAACAVKIPHVVTSREEARNDVTNLTIDLLKVARRLKA